MPSSARRCIGTPLGRRRSVFIPWPVLPLASSLSRSIRFPLLSLARSLARSCSPTRHCRPAPLPLPSPPPSPPLPLSPLPFSSAAALAFYGVRHAPTRGCMQAREKVNALKTERDALRQELVRSTDSPNRSHRTTHARTRTCTCAHARMHACSPRRTTIASRTGERGARQAHHFRRDKRRRLPRSNGSIRCATTAVLLMQPTGAFGEEWGSGASRRSYRSVHHVALHRALRLVVRGYRAVPRGTCRAGCCSWPGCTLLTPCGTLGACHARRWPASEQPIQPNRPSLNPTAVTHTPPVQQCAGECD